MHARPVEPAAGRRLQTRVTDGRTASRQKRARSAHVHRHTRAHAHASRGRLSGTIFAVAVDALRSYVRVCSRVRVRAGVRSCVLACLLACIYACLQDPARLDAELARVRGGRRLT
eukprot:1373019-Pleurochrysis_carterae.AAC.2